MKEIKFRGKKIDNGEWVYGYYLVAAGMPFISVFGKREPIPVIPETVGQYTGLNDKNGVEIYDGDIVSDGDLATRVYWQNSEAKFSNGVCSWSELLPYLEIVDNIYDKGK